ncbi:MAG TPA: YciI family protein [Solirubrobacteraceae bacterium]|nr:YciI family protein [Solirubrobacteraceae bacterium]
MPRFMMLMHPASFPEAGEAPPAELVEAMMKYADELAQAGVLLALDGLLPPSEGSRVRFDGGRPVVTDGPFTETKELIGGYWVIEASSQEEAVQWATRCPALDGDMIEVRRVQDVPA